jgi:hypothetical protein
MKRFSFSSVIVILAISLSQTGCGVPVYWGIKEVRAAGFDVPGPFGTVRSGPMGVMPAASPESAGGLVLLPEVPQPSGPADVVGVKLEHDGTMAPRPVTFGQIFSLGQIARGQTVVARVGGHDVPTQLDVKTSNPDGSARMAVVTVVAGAPANLMLTRIPNGSAPQALDLGQAAASLNLTVEIVIHGLSGDTTRQFQIGPLLSDAVRQGGVSYWLRGPLVTEARMEVLVISSLRLTSDVRAYADGSVMADLQFNNDIAMRDVGGKLNYDVTIRESGRVVLQQAKIEHFQYQTWHYQVWTKGDPEVNVVHDIPAMARAGAIHNYDVSTGVRREVLDTQLRTMSGPGFGILGNAGVTMGMGTSGGRPDIGPVTQPNTVWLMTQHPDAARFALAQADAAGSVPWHFHDLEAGSYISVAKYPKLWSDYRGGQWDTQALTEPIDGHNGWEPDNSHQPDLSYVSYILTGLRYRLDQIQAQASGTILMLSPASRQDGQAIVASAHEQVRARGWGLRGVNEAYYVCPDGAPDCGYFAMSVRNSVNYLLEEARTSTKGAAWGWFKFGSGGAAEGGVTPPWMQDFVASTLILMTQQGVPGAREVVKWQSHFLVGRFLAEEQGFHPRNATVYQINVFAKSPDEPFSTWREIEADTIAHGFAKKGTGWGYDDPAYIQAAQGVLGGMVSATSSPDAERALEWMHQNAPHAGKDDLRITPTFNIIPLRPADRRQSP